MRVLTNVEIYVCTHTFVCFHLKLMSKSIWIYHALLLEISGGGHLKFPPGFYSNTSRLNFNTRK